MIWLLVQVDEQKVVLAFDSLVEYIEEHLRCHFASQFLSHLG